MNVFVSALRLTVHGVPQLIVAAKETVFIYFKILVAHDIVILIISCCMDVGSRPHQSTGSDRKHKDCFVTGHMTIA